MSNAIGNPKDGWRIIGPGSGGGHFSPTISPHDPNVALIACDMTGSYITTDGCNTWREFNLGSRSAVFAFDPVDPNTIYTGNANLWRSTDLGRTWRSVFPRHDLVTEVRKLGDHSGYMPASTDNWPEGGYVEAILIDDSDNRIVYVAVAVRSGRALSGVSLYRTADGGDHFTLLGNVTQEGADALSIYADESAQTVVLFTTKGAFAFSTVAGKGLRCLPSPGGLDELIDVSWGRMPNGAARFYALTPSIWTGKGVQPGTWRSDDLQSWIAMDPALDDTLCEPGAASPPAYAFVRAARNDAREVYIAVAEYPHVPPDHASGSIIMQYGVLRSSDGGDHFDWVLRGDTYHDPDNRENGWIEKNYTPEWYMTGPKGAPALGMGICDTHPEHCYITDLGSGYRTTDGGATWHQLYCDERPDGSVAPRGLHVTTCFGAHVDPFDPQHLVISYTDLGMFHSFNGGESWFHNISGIPVPWGNTSYWMVFDPEIPGKAWSVWGGMHDLPRPKMYRSTRFATGQGGVAVSTDCCKQWALSNAGLPKQSVTTHLLLDPDSPAGARILYAAVYDKGVYKSTDDGATWARASQGIADNMNVWWLARGADHALYVVTARGERRGAFVSGAIYKSVDGAASWQRIALPEGVNAPNHLACDPVDANLMYLACWPYVQNGREVAGGVYRSADGGATWTCVFNPEAHVFSVELDPHDPKTLYINTFDHAAFYSNDRGDTWKRMKGYNFHWGQRAQGDPRNPGHVFLTTFGSSVWWGKAEDGTAAWEDTEPYPNLTRLDAGIIPPRAEG